MIKLFHLKIALIVFAGLLYVNSSLAQEQDTVSISIQERISVTDTPGGNAETTTPDPDTLHVSEQLMVSDQVQIQLSKEIVINEQIDVADQVGTQLPVHIEVQETISASDNIALVTPVNLTVKEEVAVSDQVTTLTPIEIVVNENISTSDNISILPPKHITVDEEISVSDSIVTSKGKLLVVNEQITVSDSVGLGKSVHLLVKETISVSDISGTDLSKYLEANSVIMVSDSVSLELSKVTSLQRDESDNLPDEFKLYSNYPNPFNPSTTIKFDLPKTTNVTLTIYNVNGNEIAELINKRMPGGTYRYTWNAEYISSGTYLYQLEAGSFQESGKMTLIK